MTEQEFIKEIEIRTGKKLEDFGFICGTRFPNDIEYTGFNSASNFDGFVVWKKEEDKAYEKKFTGKSGNIDDIVDFLNEGNAIRHIKELSRRNGNDQDLGDAVRQYINKL